MNNIKLYCKSITKEEKIIIFTILAIVVLLFIILIITFNEEDDNQQFPLNTVEEFIVGFLGSFFSTLTFNIIINLF